MCPSHTPSRSTSDEYRTCTMKNMQKAGCPCRTDRSSSFFRESALSFFCNGPQFSSYNWHTSRYRVQGHSAVNTVRILRCRVLPEKLIVADMVEGLLVFHGTRRFKGLQLCQFNPIHFFTSYLFNMHCNVFPI